MLNKALLLFHTARYLKVGQILNRVRRKFFKPKNALSVAPKTAIKVHNLKSLIKCKQTMFGDSRFNFLNKEFNLKRRQDWNSANVEKLSIYNLHYFDDLNSIGSDQREGWHNDLIKRWIDENSYGFGNAWEAYPTSLRIVNWVKWSLSGGNLNKEGLDSLASQARHLQQNLEYHLLGNHLFENAKALIFCGLYFQGVEADQWYQTGKKILKNELPEQVLSDGGNFELSPMYHSIFLEGLLDIINIHQVYAKSIPFYIDKMATNMLSWLKYMCHPDNNISFFNDSALGVAPTLNELYIYAKHLNVVYNDKIINGLKHLNNSGYIRYSGKDVVLIADVANIGPDFIPGHGHADALSFEMSIFSKRVFVNSGVSTYSLGDDRNYQRGTKSHSTIMIDNENSSQVWGGFRVAKRAKVFNINTSMLDNTIRFSACHDGYKRLKGNIVHCREWSISDNFLEILDNITGTGEHIVSSTLPLHPEVEILDIQESFVILKVEEKKIVVNFEGVGLMQVKSAKYNQEFGLSLDNKQLIYSYNGALPFTTKINISW